MVRKKGVSPHVSTKEETERCEGKVMIQTLNKLSMNFGRFLSYNEIKLKLV